MGGPQIQPRQRRGLSVVQTYRGDIRRAAQEFRVPEDVAAVILMHESQSAERAFYAWALGSADMGERLQAQIQGEDASIGLIQMRVSRARALRQRFPALRSSDSVVTDLLGPAHEARDLCLFTPHRV